jgi:hypothetical protein
VNFSFFPSWERILTTFMAHARSLGEARDPMRKILGPEVGARLKPIWGLDEEGEIRGAWRDIGVPHLWCMIGKLFFFLFFEGKEESQMLKSNLIQGTLPCADSTRSTLLYVSFSGLFR